MAGKEKRIAWGQTLFAGRFPKEGIADCEYDFWGENGARIPGHVLGKPFSGGEAPVVLWLHGGAFFLPAMPEGHLKFARRLCDDLSASAFVPDYRLAPAHPYPAGLDDCEAAYRLLLESGVPASSIVIGGESAGGNLTVSLLYRIRRKGLPMPSCAVAVSPALDLSRQHGFPARSLNARREAMLPVASLSVALSWYLGGADATDPEVSPLYGDCKGLIPMLVFASEDEILRDDSIAFGNRLSAAGVRTELAIWPHLPHAFPLLEDWFAEASEARQQICTFIGEHLGNNNQKRGTES
ncbi:alpha/beta hydrolase [Marinobacter sp. CHS3-4]|uniref:alpha/beta hydrolase n=1 Tax=Marinobacter sp. CHS3-4 TaxID=3045174 RepID=UPI0024B5E2FE|nr:alpha/beta hydrolase [Marinobacter sp. CHS3-4]MDI9245352.1 alpha/beta hydrolase [Marinobacter sp. CHS3-4]